MECHSNTEFKKNNSPGLDGFSYSCLKSIPESCSKTLLKIINKLWSKNLIPRDWNQSMLNSRLRHWTEKQHILAHIAFGIRNKRCAVDGVTMLVSDIYEAFINKQHSNAVFLDIHAAFPSLSLSLAANLRQTLTNLHLPLHFGAFVVQLMFSQTLIFTHPHTKMCLGYVYFLPPIIQY